MGYDDKEIRANARIRWWKDNGHGVAMATILIGLAMVIGGYSVGGCYLYERRPCHDSIEWHSDASCAPGASMLAIPKGEGEFIYQCTCRIGDR